MHILATSADERIQTVGFIEGMLTVTFFDGRTVSAPLSWFPRLKNASDAQRNQWEISGGGYGIHWPEIDEDLSAEGILEGRPAVGSFSMPVRVMG